MTKPNFGPDFYLFDLNLGSILAGYGPNLVPKNFLWDLTLPYVMDCCKLSLYAISRETNTPNLRKQQKKLVLGLLLVLLTQIWCPKFFSQTFPLLDVRHCCKLSLYPISRKTNEPNMRKRKKKNQFQGSFQPVLAQIWSSKNFLCVLPLLDVMHCCKLSMYAISRKTNAKKLEKITTKLVLGPIFAPLSQSWAQKLRKTNDLNLRKW